ncbi:MAG: ATP-dependent DNA helicase RecG [Patescibacteria group bacterium]
MSAAALRLTDSVTQLPRVGPAVAKKLAKLEIETVGDLLFHIPRRYEDWSTLTPIGQLQAGTIATVTGKVELITNKRSPRKRVMVTEAVLSDPTGSIKVIWFQQAFLTKILKPGNTYLFSGEVTQNQFGLFLNNLAHEYMGSGGLKAVYPQTAGVTSKLLRQLVDHALHSVQVQDNFPPDLQAKYHLVPLDQAVRWLHQPEHLQQVEQAKRRLQFGELVRYQLRALRLRHERRGVLAPPIPFSESLAKQFVSHLPFQLTAGQRKAAWRILQEMERSEAMRRLLQGDVGSGKTVVAALAMAHAVQHGFQTVLLAPTEILAQQHSKTIRSLLEPLGCAVTLATSGWDQDTSGLVFVGTHALLQQKVEFQNLGLLVIDEEHRFGVDQRQALLWRSGLQGQQPHVLSMTATPIPRTLALTIYGGVDVTYLQEKPVGRLPVRTVVREPFQRGQTLQEIERAVAQGNGVFVVCPLISPSDLLGVSSAQAESKRLKVELPGKRIGVLHGRLSTLEKQQLMVDFHGGSLDILVSTTVIEVGVDVPRATLMIIEGAERFGLAQLHQLRGRVGRSSVASTCILHPTPGTQSLERLRLLETIQNGYQLAEHDLRLRGMGELFGTKQSGTEEWLQFGLPDLALVEEAQAAAQELWERQQKK